MSIIPGILCVLCYFGYIKYQFQAELMGKLPNYVLHTKHLIAYSGISMTACMLFGFLAFIGGVHDVLWIYDSLPSQIAATEAAAVECVPDVTDTITNSIDNQLTITRD